MKTLTVTKARANLGHWIKRAIAGEEIAIIQGADVVALRLIPIEAADYAEQEYGLKPKEMDAAVKRLSRETRKILDRGDTISADAFIRELRGSNRKGRGKVRRHTASR